MSRPYVCDCCGRTLSDEEAYGDGTRPPISFVRMWVANKPRADEATAYGYSQRELDVCRECIEPIRSAAAQLAERNAKAARK